MSRVPFTRRKRKKPEFEAKPIIGIPNVEAEDPPKVEVEATPQGMVIPPEDTKDLDLRLLRKPEKVLTLDTVEHDGILELTRKVPHEDMPIIYGPENVPAETPETVTTEVKEGELKDRIKLGEGQTAIWGEAHRPPKKGEKRVIRGQ